MADIGSVSKLLANRLDTFNKQTNEIFKTISDRLTPAFQAIYESPDCRIVWTTIDSISGTDKAVTVSGLMALQIGDVISIGEQQITIDEKNINEYNKFVKFAFPIIMLELATVEELVEHINRVSKIGSAVEVTPEKLAKILDKLADAYEEKILNDPSKIETIESATKPTSIMGFSTDGLTDEQIRKLKFIEKLEVETLN